MVESSQECRWGKHFDPSSGELDGEGQTIHAPTDLGDGDGVLRSQCELGLDCLRTRDEEPNGVGGSDVLHVAMAIQCGETERGDRDLALTRDSEADPTGDQNRHVGTGAKELGNKWGGLDDLLEVVEQEQEPRDAHHRLQSLDERLVTRLAHRERLEDGRSQQTRDR